MRWISKLALLAISSSLGASAYSMASAKLTITGDQTFGVFVPSSGSQFDISLMEFTLGAGESRDLSYSYDVLLQNDGLAALPAEFACVPLHEVICSPDATGFEQSAALVTVGYVDGRAANPFISVNGEQLSFETASGIGPQRFSQSGTLHLHVTNLDTNFSQTAQFASFATAFVTASPVLPIPEPSTYLLFPAGLGVVFMARRRNPTGS